MILPNALRIMIPVMMMSWNERAINLLRCQSKAMYTYLPRDDNIRILFYIEQSYFFYDKGGRIPIV